jgi:hypothetical protein
MEKAAPFWKFWDKKPSAASSSSPKAAAQLPARKHRELGKKLLNAKGEIKLTWVRHGKASNGFTNLGDGLSAFMVANLAGLPVVHTPFESDTTRMLAVGSIGHGAKKGHAVIWGTGCYRPDILVENVKSTTYDVLAVRGNISQECLNSVGIKAPACYGEPVWFLPAMFPEEVEKKYEVGLISHISDLKGGGEYSEFKEAWAAFAIPPEFQSSVVNINTWHKPDLGSMLDKLRLIRSCKRIASRSFHGMVIAEAYGIPCISISSNPGIPSGAFTLEQVKTEQVDKRALEFLHSGKRRPIHFYGQRRIRPTDWAHLIKTIDQIWSPIDYDPVPMLEAFPFDIPVDPLKNTIPIHPSMSKMEF